MRLLGQRGVPSNPQTAGLFKYPCFFSFLLFLTTISCCNIVAARSGLLFGPLFHSSVSPARAKTGGFELYFLSFASENGGVQSPNFAPLHHLAQIAVSCPITPFHVIPLCNRPFPSSITLSALFLYVRKPPFAAGARCPAICAGWHEWLLQCRPFYYTRHLLILIPVQKKST